MKNNCLQYRQGPWNATLPRPSALIGNHYLDTLNLNVFVFFVSLCFQGFQRLAFCAYTLLTLYFLVLIQLYTRKRPARQAERLM